MAQGIETVPWLSRDDVDNRLRGMKPALACATALVVPFLVTGCAQSPPDVITYRVTGGDRVEAVDVAYALEVDGKMSIFDDPRLTHVFDIVGLPWTKDLDGGRLDVFTLKVRDVTRYESEDAGTIGCEILADGETVAADEVTGVDEVASCEYAFDE